ncbi:hypothetical protein LDC_0803 [sediment metagenome]|uniref:Uncharacterized protein n=1 Tax=sediment metagenome TaxID=749907 RepID=D9PH06_9ZZZZ
MNKKSRLYIKKLRFNNTIVIIGGVLILIFISIGFFTAIDKNDTFTHSPQFKRNLFGKWEYSTVPNSVGVSTYLSKTDTQALINIKRLDSQIQFAIPLKESTLKKQNNSVSYTIPQDSIEVKYTPTNNGVKEDIILHKVPQKTQFPINVEFTNLTAYITPSGIPVFYDNNGNYQFHFEKPFMEDSRGEVSYKVRYKFIDPETGEEIKGEIEVEKDKDDTSTTKRLTKELLAYTGFKSIDNTGNMLLVLEADEQWIKNSQRVYPITIDPTVVHDESSEFTGEKDRVYDTGSGSSPSLESYYQELAADHGPFGHGEGIDCQGDSL